MTDIEPDEAKGSSLATWAQIDVVVAEIVQLEGEIAAETAYRNRRILKVKEMSDKVVQAKARREHQLFDMLNKFAEDHYPSGELTVTRLASGVVRVEDGVCSVQFNRGNDGAKR